MEVIDDIKFSDISEVLIEHFHEQMDHLKVCQFIVSSVHADREEQPSVSLVDYLVVTELTKRKRKREKTIEYISLIDQEISILIDLNTIIS